MLFAYRFDRDQTFSSLQATTLETMDVIDGTWYVYLKGDYAGRVSGAVYDIRNSSDPIKLITTVSAATLPPSMHTTALHQSSPLHACQTDFITLQAP